MYRRSRAWELLLAEEVSRRRRQSIGESPIRYTVASMTESYSTEQGYEKRIVVDGRYTLLRAEGSGRLEEAAVVSNTREYRLRIVVDGATAIDEEYYQLESISPVVDSISAVRDEDGRYVVSLSNIYFSRSLVVEVEGHGMMDFYYKLVRGTVAPSSSSHAF